MDLATFVPSVRRGVRFGVRRVRAAPIAAEVCNHQRHGGKVLGKS